VATRLSCELDLPGSDDENGTTRQLGSQTNGQEKGTGGTLLKVVRLLVEMDPEERIALIKLLKVLE